MLRKILIVISSILLASCASKQALPLGYNGPVATIQETTIRVDQGKAQMFYLSDINDIYITDNSASRSFGASIGMGNNLTIIDSAYEIPAEQQKYKIVGSHIWAMDGRGILEADLTVSGDITFLPKAGRTYLINGSLSKEKSVVWIKDTATGEIIAEFEKLNP